MQRTIITHQVVLGYIDEKRKAIEVQTGTMAKLPTNKELKELSEQYGKRIIVLEDTPIENLYKMDLETFLEHAELVDATDAE